MTKQFLQSLIGKSSKQVKRILVNQTYDYDFVPEGQPILLLQFQISFGL